MRCEAAEREISCRLDGSPDPMLDGALSRHLSGCARCRLFEEKTARIRSSVRMEVAGDLPSHVLDGIMQEVQTAVHPSDSRLAQPRRIPGWIPTVPLYRLQAAAPYAAAFFIGALATAVALGGLVPLGPQPALAREIPRRIVEASGDLDEYHATLQVTEHNYHPQVPVREFRTSVDYAGPERFRTETTDLTKYPSEAWPRNNITLDIREGHQRLTAPGTCPRQALPACAPSPTQVRSIGGLEPFDSRTQLPTDIVLPLRTLAGTERVQVVGEGEVLGRQTVQVRMAHRDALALFSFLEVGGSWRPYFSTDQVTVSLDAKSWFPLAYEVRASRAPERAEWARSQGLDADQPGSVIFEARVTKFDRPADPETPLPEPPGETSGGFVELPLEALAATAGYEPTTPADLGGLLPHRAGVYADEQRQGEVLTSFTEGLGWLKIRETKSWSQPALFGNISSLATEIDLPGGGIAYYEPATQSLGRRLSVHAQDRDLYLETNLDRDRLLEIASSLSVEGRSVPAGWATRQWSGGIVREQLSLGDAAARASYLKMPKRVPDGYELTNVHLVESAGTEGITVYLRRPGMEMDGVGIRIHQSQSSELPPPLDPDVLRVQLSEHSARYSPSRNELEWIDRGVYRSVSARSFDLAGLVQMAESMQRVEEDAVR